MKKCLVIDDAHVIRKVAHAILKDLNYTVLEADNTEDAYEICKTQEPDVIILDWHIPNSEPLNFLVKLRNGFSGRRPYVIYCTTERDLEVIERARDAGADNHLLKPFDRTVLISKFAELKRAA